MPEVLVECLFLAISTKADSDWVTVNVRIAAYMYCYLLAHFKTWSKLWKFLTWIYCTCRTCVVQISPLTERTKRWDPESTCATCNAAIADWPTYWRTLAAMKPRAGRIACQNSEITQHHLVGGWQLGHCRRTDGAAARYTKWMHTLWIVIRPVARTAAIKVQYSDRYEVPMAQWENWSRDVLHRPTSSLRYRDIGLGLHAMA